MRVVSSDLQVQRVERALNATMLTSEEFVTKWQSILAKEPDLNPRNKPLTQEEIEAWEDIFKKGD